MKKVSESFDGMLLDGSSGVSFIISLSKYVWMLNCCNVVDQLWEMGSLQRRWIVDRCYGTTLGGFR